GATVAVPRLAGLADHERRALLRMEWTQPLVLRPAPLQRDVTADDLDDVQTGFDLGDSVYGHCPPSPGVPVTCCRTASGGGGRQPAFRSPRAAGRRSAAPARPGAGPARPVRRRARREPSAAPAGAA